MSENHPLNTAITLNYMYFAAFAIMLLFAGLLFQIGSSGNIVNQFMLTFLVSSYVFVGILAKTMSMNSFQYANHRGRQIGTGQATASGAISSGIFILLAGEFYSSGTAAFAHYWGWISGLVLMIFLFSAFVRRSGNVTLPSMVESGRSNVWLSIATTIVTLLCCGLLLLVQLEYLVLVGERFLSINRVALIYVTSLSIGFCVLVGGILGVTIIRQISYAVILTCFLLPLIWLATKVAGIPIPQFAIGVSAFAPIAEINKEILATDFGQTSEVFDITLNSANYDLLGFFSVMVCIACGLAAMPHLLHQFAIVENGTKARRTGYVALILTILFITAVPTIAAFVKLDIYTSLLGLQVGDLATEAEWMFALSGAGSVNLISICGALVANLEQAVAACGSNPTYFLSIDDVKLSPELIALASPALHQVPELLSITLSIGAAFALYTTIDGLFLTMGLTISNDGYRRLIRPQSPKSVRLFMTRVFTILVIAAAAYITVYIELNRQLLFEASFALTAASLFPVLVLRVWGNQASGSLLLWTLMSGFVTTAGLLFLGNFGTDFVMSNGDELQFGIPGVTQQVTNFGYGLIGLILAGVPSALHFLCSFRRTTEEPQDATT